MAERPERARDVKDDMRGLGISEHPGKRWASELLASVDNRIAASDAGYREVAKESGAKKEDLAVFKTRAEQANIDYDALEDERDALQDKLDALQDPEKRSTWLPFASSINEMKVRWTTRKLHRRDVMLSSAKQRALEASADYETATRELDRLDRQRLMHSESMTGVLRSAMDVVDQRLRPVNEIIERIEGLVRTHEERVNTATTRMETLRTLRRQKGRNAEEVSEAMALQERMKAEVRTSQKELRELQVRLKAAHAHRERIEKDRDIVKVSIDKIAARYSLMIRRPDGAPPAPVARDTLPSSAASTPGERTAIPDVRALAIEWFREDPISLDTLVQTMADDFDIDDLGDSDTFLQAVEAANTNLDTRSAGPEEWRNALLTTCEANTTIGDFFQGHATRLRLDRDRLIEEIVGAATVNNTLATTA